MENNFFSLSKKAKAAKDFELEKKYLEQALLLDENNTKVLNALIRNARRLHDLPLEKKYLEKLLSIRPSGEILFELIKIARREGNSKREKELLLMKSELEPDNKSLKRKVEKTNENQQNNPDSSFKETIPFIFIEDPNIIVNAREIIYSDEDINNKLESLKTILSSSSPEILLCLLVEFYVNESYRNIAIKYIKEYKRNLNPETDIKKIKLANKLFSIASNHRSRKYHFDDFWCLYKLKITNFDEQQLILGIKK